MHVFEGNPLGRGSIHDPLIHYVAHNIAPNKVVGLKAHIYETSYTKIQTIWCWIDPRARGYISAIYFDGIDGPPKAGGTSKGCTRYGMAVWSARFVPDASCIALILSNAVTYSVYSVCTLTAILITYCLYQHSFTQPNRDAEVFTSRAKAFSASRYQKGGGSSLRENGQEPYQSHTSESWNGDHWSN